MARDKDIRPSEDVRRTIRGTVDDESLSEEAARDARATPGADGAPEEPHPEAADKLENRKRQDDSGPQSGPANTGRNPGGSPDR